MNKNESIKCTVEQCKHHACSENYCTLNSMYRLSIICIKVSTTKNKVLK